MFQTACPDIQSQLTGLCTSKTGVSVEVRNGSGGGSGGDSGGGHAMNDLSLALPGARDKESHDDSCGGGCAYANNDDDDNDDDDGLTTAIGTPASMSWSPTALSTGLRIESYPVRVGTVDEEDECDREEGKEEELKEEEEETVSNFSVHFSSRIDSVMEWVSRLRFPATSDAATGVSNSAVTTESSTQRRLLRLVES